MEAEMKEMDVKQGKKAYSEDANVDEAIPIQIRKEITKEAYKEKTNEDIETIEKYENRTVVQRSKWMTNQRKMLYRMMIILMKRSQSKLENKEEQKHKKKNERRY